MKIWITFLLGLSVFHVGSASNVTNEIQNEETKHLLSEANLTESVLDEKPPLIPHSDSFNNIISKSVLNKTSEPIDKEVIIVTKSLLSMENSTASSIIPEVIDKSSETTKNLHVNYSKESTAAAIIESTEPSITEETLQDGLNFQKSSAQITSTTIQPSTLNSSNSSRVTPTVSNNKVDPEIILLRQKAKDQENEMTVIFENMNKQLKSKNEIIEKMTEQINEKQVIIENRNKQIKSKNEIIDKMAEMHKKEKDAIEKGMKDIIKSKDETIGQMEETIRSKDETIKKTEESSKIQKEFETFKLNQCQATLSSLTAKQLETSPAECNFDASEFEQLMQDLSFNIALKIEEVQNITGSRDQCICDDFSILSIASPPPTSMLSYMNSTENLLISEAEHSEIQEDVSSLFQINNETIISEMTKSNETIISEMSITNGTISSEMPIDIGTVSLEKPIINGTVISKMPIKNLTRVWIWLDWCSWYEVELDQESPDDCQFGIESNEFYSGPGVEIQDCSVFLAVGGVMGCLLVVASIMMCILALRLRKVTKKQKRRKLEEVMRDHRRRYGLEPGGGGVYRGEP